MPFEHDPHQSGQEQGEFRHSLSHRTEELLEQSWDEETEVQLMALTAGLQAVLSTPSLLWFQNYRNEEDMRDRQVIDQRTKARGEAFEAWQEMNHGKSDIVLQMKLLAEALKRTNPRERYRFAQNMHLNRDRLEQATDLWEGLALNLGAKKYPKDQLIAALEHPNQNMLTYLLIYNFHDHIFIRNLDRAEQTSARDRYKLEDPEGWKRMVDADRKRKSLHRREILKWYVQSGTFTPQDGHMPHRTEYAISPLSVAGRGTSYPEIIIGLQPQRGRAIVQGRETERWYISLAHPITPRDLVLAQRRGLPRETDLRMSDLATKYDPASDELVTKWQVFNNAGPGEKIGHNWDETQEPNTPQAVEAFATYLAHPQDLSHFPVSWTSIIVENERTFHTLRYLWTVSKGRLYQEPPADLVQWYKERLERCDNASCRQDLITQDERLFTLKKVDFIGNRQETELKAAYPFTIVFAGLAREISYALNGDALSATITLSIPTEGIKTVEDLPTEPAQYEVGPEGEKIPIAWNVETIKATIPQDPDQRKIIVFRPIKETNLPALKELCIKARDKEIEKEMKLRISDKTSADAPGTTPASQ